MTFTNIIALHPVGRFWAKQSWWRGTIGYFWYQRGGWLCDLHDTRSGRWLVAAAPVHAVQMGASDWEAFRPPAWFLRAAREAALPGRDGIC